MAGIIEVDGLGLSYGRHRALDGLSLTVEPGEVYALLGRNGAGKSSLMRCLLGWLRPEDGSCRVFGMDCWRDRARLMARVGVVPEEPDAPPQMTALALSRLVARLRPHWRPDEYEKRLRRFEVPLQVPFRKLSKGQKAQVMLALALASEPELLLLDEPTLGLDAVARRMVFEELVAELADRGTTVFLTSHDLAGIEGIATRVAFMRQGALLVDEELESLKARFRRLYLGSTRRPNDGVDVDASLERLAVLSRTPRGRRVEAVVSRFDAALVEELRSAGDGETCEEQAMSLEEIFVAVTNPGASANDQRTFEDNP
jgi:ABC-type multidrug transport system ATPase subunit